MDENLQNQKMSFENDRKKRKNFTSKMKNSFLKKRFNMGSQEVLRKWNAIKFVKRITVILFHVYQSLHLLRLELF